VTVPAASATCRLGLVALGDSITVGEGALTLGVRALSWAQWLAMALDLPFTSYASNGAVAAGLRALQLPRVVADYDLAALYAGVNDVRSPGFDEHAYERDLDAIAAGLVARASQLLMVTMPHDLGRPTSAPKPLTANAIVRRVAERHGATLADLADFGGWTMVIPDAVHPTPLGQLEIADRAARALGAQVLPSSLVEPEAPGPRYAAAYARMAAAHLGRRVRERSQQRLAEARARRAAGPPAP
jgi:lysophospholipase L1-like esterase